MVPIQKNRWADVGMRVVGLVVALVVIAFLLSAVAGDIAFEFSQLETNDSFSSSEQSIVALANLWLAIMIGFVTLGAALAIFGIWRSRG